MTADDDEEMTAEELAGQNAEVWKRRALEAEAKLAALVEAAKRFARVAMGTPGYFDAVGALYDEDELGPIADAARDES